MIFTYHFTAATVSTEANSLVITEVIGKSKAAGRNKAVCEASSLVTLVSIYQA